MNIPQYKATTAVLVQITEICQRAKFETKMSEKHKFNTVKHYKYRIIRNN